MQVFGGLTHAQAQKQRRALMRDIERDHRRKDRERLATIRNRIAEIKNKRREALKEAVERCRIERQLAKEHARELRAKAKAAVRAAVEEEKLANRQACALRKAGIRDRAAKDMSTAEGERTEERRYQRQVAHADKRQRKDSRSAAERRQESDDEVRRNLDPEMLVLFEKVKRQIHGSDRMSRTEAFYRYLEENPGELVGAIEEDVARELRELERESKKLRKASARPRRATAEELAAVPF